MSDKSISQLLSKITLLEEQLAESEQLINAIKAGEVDAFAINKESQSEIYTLQSGDYAYRLLIEEFGEGALNVTEDGLIVYTNRYFLDLLNVPYKEVVGSYIFDFIHFDSELRFRQLFREAVYGKSKGEVNLVAKDAVIPVYISLASLQPKLATIGIVITDFTEKKRNERLILEYQKTLEKKNHELTQINSELASFAYIASHDLQEPLRKIQTFATRLLEKEFEKLSDSGKDYFKRMQNAAYRMQNLIEDLLSYSRTNTAEKKFIVSDLNKIVEDVKEELKEELLLKQAVIEINDLGCVPIIPFQFRQMIHNLVTNSLKFSISGQAPLIRIEGTNTEGVSLHHEKSNENISYCHLAITDNGIGFDQKYSDRIFDLFQRLHGRTEYKGTGIGLAIVKRIVENHNGFISARSEVNKGATFDIYLPLTRNFRKAG